MHSLYNSLQYLERKWVGVLRLQLVVGVVLAEANIVLHVGVTLTNGYLSV